MVPKCFKPYKIFTINSLDEYENIQILICFVFFKYMDSESYMHIFKYLNETYKFEPSIIHSDFETTISKAEKKCKFFKKK